MRVLGFANFLGIHLIETADMQQAVVGVLVIDSQQAAARTLQRKKFQSIVVHAHLHRLIFSRVAAIHFEGRHTTCYAHWLTPRGQRHRRVAFWHDQLIAHTDWNGLESKFLLGSGKNCAPSQRRHDRGQ